MDEWAYSTVERLLRNPVLAGMTSVSIMSAAEWRAMVKALDERDSAQTKPRALRSATSALLSGLVRCGEHDAHTGVRMHRGTTQGRHGYSCPVCHQTITNFEDFIVAEFLRMKGERVRWSVVQEVHEGGAAMLPEIEHRLAELGAELQATDDDAEADRLTAEIANLRKLRRDARAQAPTLVLRPVRHTQSFGEDWADATTVEEKRAVLDDALEAVWIVRGRTGRGLDTSRLIFDWRLAEDMGPIEAPDDQTLASWAD